MAFRLLPNNVKQWKVVIMAFAVATTFWFFNSLNKNYTTTLLYPVNFVYNQDSLISVRSLPSSIDLDVTGGGWSLLRKEPLFNPTPLEIILKNPVGVSYLNWKEMIPMIREQIGEININQVLEDTLRLQIEPILKKEVTLWVDSLKIKLDDNYRLVSSISLPTKTITLVGPKSFIDTLESQFELKILEAEIDENFDDEVLVVVPRPGLIRSEPASVQTVFSVERFDKLQIEVPVEMINFPTDSSLVPSLEKVVVEFIVQRSLQTEYLTSDFGVIADFNMMDPQDSTVDPLIVHYPEEIVDITVVPKKISVVPNE